MSGEDVSTRGLHRALYRRDVVRLIAAAPFVPIPSSMATAHSRRTEMITRPNILIMHCHDLGQFLHCYGVPAVRTPNIDAFAAEGVRFARSYCTAPQCSPSRASIFTGRYPHNNGVMGLCHADFAWEFYPNERHLGQILKDAGYHTVGIGILHETRSGPVRCGLDEYVAMGAVTKVTDTAIERLERFPRSEHDRPFYMQVGCIEPHRLPGTDPWGDQGFIGTHMKPDTELGANVPGYLKDTDGARTEIAELQGAVHHVDQEFGRLMAVVRDLKLDDDTLVIFTTDHGVGLPRAKAALYDPGLEVAFILRLPSRKGWHGGLTMTPMISNIDYLPTILDVAGVPVPTNVQGRSFAPLLDGRNYTSRDAIFGEMTYHDYYDPRRCIRTETHKLIVNLSSAPYFMDPSQSWRPRADTIVPKNNRLASHPPIELYDLQEDPFELRDVAEDPAHAEIRTQLLARLHEHLVETEDPILNGAIVCPMHHRAVKLLQEAGSCKGQHDAQMKIQEETFTYKKVGDCEIRADVYRSPEETVRPAIMWIHGGALIAGARGDISRDQMERYVRAGYALISIDYRLAPETKLNAIMEDVKDAYKWIRERGPKLCHVDPDRVAVVGHSAGGYLTLMSGIHLRPRPKALVSFYGYGDIAGPWYSRPDPFYCKMPAVSKEQAYASVGSQAISETPAQHNRALFYLYCRQQGLWPKEVTGHDPNTQPHAFDPLCPMRNVTKDYPPTLLLHGDKDTDVPYELSAAMADALRRVGVEHEFITIPNGGHGFDMGTGKAVADAFDRVIGFLRKYMHH